MFSFLADLFGIGGPKWSREEIALFRETALAEPGDAGPRLRLAAALEKRGEAMGEYIRLTHEAEALPEGDPRRARLDERIGHLLVTHGKRWCRPMRRFGLWPEIIGEFCPVLWMTYNGMLDTLVLDRSGILPERAAAVFAAMPGLRVLTVASCPEYGRPDVAAIARMPQAEQLTELDTSSVIATLDDLRAVTESPYLKNLRTLKMQGDFRDEGGRLIGRSRTLTRLRSLKLNAYSLSDDGAAALAESANLAGVTELALLAGSSELPRIGPRGAAALAGSPHLAAVRSLVLTGHRIGAAGVAALAGSPHLRLAVLRITHNHLDADAGRALGSAAWLAGVTDLDLGGNALGDGGLAGLAAGRLSSLRVLALTGNALTGKGLAALLAADLPALAELTVSANDIGPDGVEALASTALPALRKLELAYNPLGDAGVRLLARSPLLESLAELKLSSCDLGPEGVRALVGSPRLRKLRELNLGTNPIGEDGAEALATSPHLSGLARLDLSGCELPERAVRRLRDRFDDVLISY